MKVLILGNGNHTNKRILPALEKISKIELITIADKNVIQDVRIKKNIKISKFDEATFSDENYNLSIIATPPYNHIESFLKVYKNSEKVLIEKPITNDINFIFGNKLKEYIDNKKIFETLMYFHHPLWERIKNIIETKSIVSVSTEFSVPHLPKESYRYVKKSGGGSLNDQGIYPISLCAAIISNKYKINQINVYGEKNYEVDLSGEINMTIDNKIEFNGKWGLGQEYKNFICLTEEDGTTYEANFFYSKPDETHSKIIISKGQATEELSVGTYDQFKIMYLDALKNNFDKFNYSDHKRLIKRYEIYKLILNEITF